MIPHEKLVALFDRHAELQHQMNNPADLHTSDFARISKEFSDLEPVVACARRMEEAEQEKTDLLEMLEGDDPDMRALAAEELKAVKGRLASLEKELQLLLLPKDSADDLPAILEIRAGTGGEEAALFAGDLYRMYQRYADHMGWRMEMISASSSDTGGFKEVIATIAGKGVFAHLKFESGVHRVQRVPVTESGGRIHTSAATVAVLPEPTDVDIKIDDKDIRIDVFRASGPGGQSVNTTDSAVRITHLPTGVVVSQQDEKSQHKNREKAMKVLRARLYEHEREKVARERADARKLQVGSGDRSERIRTYNFPQGRVTDHRINLSLHKLDQIMAGAGLSEVIDALMAEDQAERLLAMESAF
ncbi:peptide chain release factor 1 [Iodidimonas gelatinilytica]|uniref:Peptide chain release factor 1 n=1 Tax=Iodidimonas gelatinilytica TaxID=1236966 RepID=A0A5A7MY93_9PROT|nr:peptide chain release factor 1 [Iodidimonas gelatinilytica]GER01041.1 peptide chain release factor 1 [Iodidimonas gelatinilytica]